MIASTIRVPGLEHDEQNLLDQLLHQLEVKNRRNLLRSRYYDGRNAVRDLGISTPPNFRHIATVLGWPAKAVDVLNRRCNLDGFVIPGGSAEDLGIPELWDANHLDSEAPQAGVSSLIHSVSWLIATLGDEASGEPPVVISAKDAMSGTALRDVRTRRLSAFLSIIDCDEHDKPTEMVLYLPDQNLTMTRGDLGWSVDARKHNLGRVPVEPLVYQPRLGRPFGSSRISRAVMSLTDSALRTVVRSEVSAEFYSAPQRYLLGADESAFMDAAGNVKTAWQAILGRVWAVDSDEDGNTPTVGQFPQMTQQPHMDQLRAWAQLFAGETSIPVSSLGISTDANPASAEAYHASREDLIQEAEGTTDGWSPAWVRTMLTAVQLRDGLDAVPPEMSKLRAKWRNPATPSRASAADAMVKLITAFPWMADSEVALEEVGFDQTQVDRLMADKRRAGGSAALRAIAEAAANNRPAVSGGDGAL